MSGVKIERLSEGDGQTFPTKGNTVVIHYFDSSRDRGKPFECKIGVGKVIKGWDEAIPQLSRGEKARITIPPEMGYGAGGYPPVIPGNSTLIFEVELLEIK